MQLHASRLLQTANPTSARAYKTLQDGGEEELLLCPVLL